MKNINEEYFEGFEGEAEILLTIEKIPGKTESIGIWSGYFDSIIEKIQPINGYWTGLAYYYHLDIGWYEESPWQVDNLKEAYEQLAEIDKESLEYPQEKEILGIILSMFKEAIENGYKIYISYE